MRDLLFFLLLLLLGLRRMREIKRMTEEMERERTEKNIEEIRKIIEEEGEPIEVHEVIEEIERETQIPVRDMNPEYVKIKTKEIIEKKRYERLKEMCPHGYSIDVCGNYKILRCDKTITTRVIYLYPDMIPFDNVIFEASSIRIKEENGRKYLEIVGHFGKYQNVFEYPYDIVVRFFRENPERDYITLKIVKCGYVHNVRVYRHQVM